MSHEVAKPHGGAAGPIAAPGGGLGPSGVRRHRPFAYLFPETRKPKNTEPFIQNIFAAAAVVNPNSGGSEALPGTLPERGIITGGLYIAMPASGVMRE